MMIRSHRHWVFSSGIIIFFSLLVHSLASSSPHFCRDDQRDALLEFRGEFPINASFHVMNQWRGPWNKSTDCCLWNGVTCNDKSGQVISLDIPNTFLNNNLKTNSSLFKLQYLRHLDLTNCNLYGEIPSSLGNLSHLTLVNLYFNNSNNFTSTFPFDMSIFHNLEYFDVSYNSFSGPFPKSLLLIPSLESIYLQENQFTGPIEFANTSSSTKLQDLILGRNRLHGPIPESISRLLNLEELDISHNNFTGAIPPTISKLVKLLHLDLSKNNLEGEVPACLWRLNTMVLSHNSFSSFENTSQEEALIEELDLNSNSFQGPIPYMICKLSSLGFLDLSNNLFSGSIPSCIRNFSGSIKELNLGDNNFTGTLPDIFSKATELVSLDVSHNQLEGKFPKSLINCKALELVNVESNKIKDTFPSWLESLPSLHVLNLRSNKFYGPMYHGHASIGFQSLRIIDISHNNFSGTLPPYYFSNWKDMTTLTEENDQYMTEFWRYADSYYHEMEMVNKGVDMSFERIRRDFRAIDFSGNKINGNIPESLGYLKELRVLNLSGNAFTSVIPRFLANLTKLETLDLSRNKLSGQIPQDLAALSFLSYMNFSHNLLQGPVPRGTQFQRQKCSSFLDNPGLYGLEDICRDTGALNPTSQLPEDLSEAEENMFNWVAAAIAYGPGVLCGLVIGHFYTSHNHEWFTEKFGRKQHKALTSVKCSL
ncbi:unnamed protein product [Arabidopsis thaliana]|uniref:Receptor like protein n=1 Tax=Arabidopsis thaliana TaxID=3702 RepID=A0A7G2E496_ARATH|nr:unnamed protein product [Arabidopsis thaliana]